MDEQVRESLRLQHQPRRYKVGESGEDSRSREASAVDVGRSVRVLWLNTLQAPCVQDARLKTEGIQQDGQVTHRWRAKYARRLRRCPLPGSGQEQSACSDVKSSSKHRSVDEVLPGTGRVSIIQTMPRLLPSSRQSSIDRGRHEIVDFAVCTNDQCNRRVWDRNMSAAINIMMLFLCSARGEDAPVEFRRDLKPTT